MATNPRFEGVALCCGSPLVVCVSPRPAKAPSKAVSKDSILPSALIHEHPIDASPALRLATHKQQAARLERASDAALTEALSRTSVLSDGHGSVRLDDSGPPLFVKLLPLSDLELSPGHRESTANVFQLPSYFQYRIGSCGFGAWRELQVHRAASDWVLSGECSHVPLLHHWRIVPFTSGPQETTHLKVWGDSPAIKWRYTSAAQATSSLALFLECFPQTLGRWLQDALGRWERPLERITALEAVLLEQLTFIHSRGVLHMDAHFDNILTDGQRLFWSDFGLSLSRDFRLGADERRFFEGHGDFDRCTIINSLVHAIVSHYDGREDWRTTLRELSEGGDVSGDSPCVPDDVRAYLARRAPLVAEIGYFYASLIEDHTTAFPADRLRECLAGL